jgi:hypothetical protein
LARVVTVDWSFVFKDGAVVDTGTQVELLVRDELYMDLVKCQLTKQIFERSPQPHDTSQQPRLLFSALLSR